MRGQSLNHKSSSECPEPGTGARTQRGAKHFLDAHGQHGLAAVPWRCIVQRGSLGWLVIVGSRLIHERLAAAAEAVDFTLP